MSTSRRDYSLRPDARARYRQAALEAALTAPPPAGPSLTDEARKLYEDGVVPVREIALICRVSERTIYKYARKGQWCRRGPSATKGAGGRFVSHTQAGLPVARGLKATDPNGAASAVEALRLAAAQARDALEAAASARDGRAERYASGHLVRALLTLFRIELDRGARRAGAKGSAPRGKPGTGKRRGYQWRLGMVSLPGPVTPAAPPRAAPAKAEVPALDAETVRRIDEIARDYETRKGPRVRRLY